MYGYNTPIKVLPREIQLKWRASIDPAPDNVPAFRLVHIRPTLPKTFEEQRIVVGVLDEDGRAVPSVKVVFSYDTAKPFIVDEDFTWTPPQPWRGDVFYTRTSGEIEHIQGSAVKPGEPGGITAYILHPEFPSDIVRGLGMLGDHTGLYLLFQLIDPTRQVIAMPVTQIAAQIADLTGQARLLTQRVEELEKVYSYAGDRIDGLHDRIARIEKGLQKNE